MIQEQDMVQILTIDFETYYDKKFSLTKLTTEEYINDPQFQVIGVGVKVNKNASQFRVAPDAVDRYVVISKSS